MDLIGTINCEMTQDKWASLIDDRDELTRVEQITVVNPFTQETVTVGKAGECVAITIGGAEVGAMRWCEQGSGVDVHGDADALEAFIASITDSCSGTFNPVG